MWAEKQTSLGVRNLLLESLHQKCQPGEPAGALSLHIPSHSEALGLVEDGLEKAWKQGRQPSLESVVHLKSHVSVDEKAGKGMCGNLRELEERKAELLRTGRWLMGTFSGHTV